MSGPGISRVSLGNNVLGLGGLREKDAAATVSDVNTTRISQAAFGSVAAAEKKITFRPSSIIGQGDGVWLPALARRGMETVMLSGVRDRLAHRGIWTGLPKPMRCGHGQAHFAVLLALLAGAAVEGIRAQDSPIPVQKQSEALLGLNERAIRNAAGCLEPPPLPGIDDYNGPLEKAVGIFARALERKSAVHEYQYKPGTTLCSPTVKDKFWLFVDDSLDPMTFIAAGFDAGIDHANNRDPEFLQGTGGYAMRFASDLTDRVSKKFWKDFAYASLFLEDPRYFPLQHGATDARLLHAAAHLVVAHRANGSHMFNYSEWLGTVTAVLLSDLHHPGNQHGTWPKVREVGYYFAWDIGFDVLREFWPDIARRLKLSFRGAEKPMDSVPGH